jgi:hypothetical protein
MPGMFPRTHRMYVCDLCGWGHFHPLIYCQKCPGKLRLQVREVPMPSGQFETQRDIQSHLKTQGITWTGEYGEEIK